MNTKLEVWTLDPNCKVELLKDVTMTPFPMGHIACFSLCYSTNIVGCYMYRVAMDKVL